MIHERLVLQSASHAYPILIGQTVYANAELLAKYIQGQQVLIVTQTAIAEHYLANIQQALTAYCCNVVMLPAGETAKNLDAWQTILDTLIQQQHDRTTTLLAVGGGVVGDVTGFAAACYQRGVAYIQIPTTLIAQVDAAIGGKTAVNHASGKNLIGAFHQPQAVIIDMAVLATLPQRDYIAGLAEVVKYGVIADADFFAWLEAEQAAIRARTPVVLLEMVRRSVAIKTNLVMQDEFDRGLRQLLNFGHTFGHALEVISDYQQLLHGEAVAIGMVIAALLAERLGLCAAVVTDRLVVVLQQLELPLQQILPSAADLLQHMRRDKKVQAGRLQLILPTQIGCATKVVFEQEGLLQAVLDDFAKRVWESARTFPDG